MLPKSLLGKMIKEKKLEYFYHSIPLQSRHILQLKQCLDPCIPSESGWWQQSIPKPNTTIL
jgi:hypothetical protein